LANILTRNPIVLDSPLASYKSSTASTLGTLTTLVITKIRWVGTGAAGQTLEVVDPSGGAQLAMLTSVGSGQDIEEDFSASPRLVSDFGVPNVPSGKVFVFTK
jgi:hypothetical protein